MENEKALSMVTTGKQTGLMPIITNGKQAISDRPRQNIALSSTDTITYLGIAEIKSMINVISETRNGRRDSLVIKLLFDAGIRASELLELSPLCVISKDNMLIARNLKRHKGRIEYSKVVISDNTMSDLVRYITENRISEKDRIFPFGLRRLNQIITRSMELAGIILPPKDVRRTGKTHILRHSCAINLLKRTGNIRLVQNQLRHSQVNMSLTYLKTLSKEQLLKERQNIDVWQ